VTPPFAPAVAVVASLALAACGSKPAPADEPEPVASAAPKAKKGKAKPKKPAAKAPARATGNAMVDAHNAYRAKHCAPPLVWSDKLAKVAQRWADTLVKKGCAFEHSGSDLGENLAAGTSGAFPPERVVEMWYREVDLYDFKKGGFSMETGHFTQVVWKGTKSVGCGKATCNGLDVYVCNYDPAGNWERQYKQNVLPTSCK
jgi:uncharacterized protein YkwD